MKFYTDGYIICVDVVYHIIDDQLIEVNKLPWKVRLITPDKEYLKKVIRLFGILFNN